MPEREETNEEWLARRIKENTLGTGADTSKLTGFERQGVAMAKGAIGNLATEHVLPFMYNSVPESFLNKPRPEGGFTPGDFEREAAIAKREGSNIATGFGAASTIIPAAKVIGGLANAGKVLPAIFGSPTLTGQAAQLAAAGGAKTAATDVLPDLASGAAGDKSAAGHLWDITKGAIGEAAGAPIGYLAQRILDPAGLALRQYGKPIADDLVTKVQEFIKMGKGHGETVPATSALRQVTGEVKGSTKEIQNAADMQARLNTDLARAGAGAQEAAKTVGERNQEARAANQAAATAERDTGLARTTARSEGRAGAHVDLPDWAKQADIMAARDAAVAKMPQPEPGTRSTDSPQAWEGAAQELRSMMAAERNPVRLAQLQQAHQTLLEQLAERVPTRSEVIPAAERLGDLDRLAGAQRYHPEAGPAPKEGVGERIGLGRNWLGAGTYVPAAGAMLYGNPGLAAAGAGAAAGLQGARALNRALEVKALPDVIDRLLNEGGDVLSQVGRNPGSAIGLNVAGSQALQGAGGPIAQFPPAQEMLGPAISGLLPPSEQSTEELIQQRELARAKKRKRD